MNTPEAFVQLAQLFLPNYGEPWKNIDEMIAVNTMGRSLQMKRVSRQYLEQILSDGTTDKGLKEIWDNTSPIYWFGEDSIRVFLSKLRDVL